MLCALALVYLRDLSIFQHRRFWFFFKSCRTSNSSIACYDVPLVRCGEMYSVKFLSAIKFMKDVRETKKPIWSLISQLPSVMLTASEKMSWTHKILILFSFLSICSHFIWSLQNITSFTQFVCLSNSHGKVSCLPICLLLVSVKGRHELWPVDKRDIKGRISKMLENCRASQCYVLSLIYTGAVYRL